MSCLDPPLCYSVGMRDSWQHPELLLYGLDIDGSMAVLGEFADAVASGERFKDGDKDRERFPRLIASRTIPRKRYLGVLAVTIEVDGALDFEALQVVTSDAQGRFPWDEGCERDVVEAQPILGIAPG